MSVKSIKQLEKEQREKTYPHITKVKWARRELDDILQKVKAFNPTKEVQQVVIKIQESIMWLGMELKRINEETPGVMLNPYPNSKDPSNTIIDKTADGLKL